MSKVIVKYGRHGGSYEEEFATVEEALEFIDAQEDRGEIWARSLWVDGRMVSERKKPWDSLIPSPERQR
jgi:hypothetical protein